jgi:hypothetical protein
LEDTREFSIKESWYDTVAINRPKPLYEKFVFEKFIHEKWERVVKIADT